MAAKRTPHHISFISTNISYTYDAPGTKLSSVKTVPKRIISRISSTITMVASNLYKWKTAGLSKRTGFNYEYTLTDHLGNNRVTFDRTNGKVGEEDYYPFGLIVHRQANAGNKYLYNKKELQDGLNQYDYGARFYDPVIARWTGIDKLAFEYFPSSPFNYTNNNPINLIDPDGKKSLELQLMTPQRPLKICKPYSPIRVLTNLEPY